MGSKIKGLLRGFKCFSQIFVGKEERELNIGPPTGVKHTAHVGFDNQATNTPAWMNDMSTSSNFSSRSLNLSDDQLDFNSLPASTWSSQDFEKSIATSPISDIFKDTPPVDLPKVPRKHKRKKAKSVSSSSESSSRFFLKSKSKDPVVNKIPEIRIIQNTRVVS